VLVCASCVAVLCEAAEPKAAASMACAAAGTEIDASPSIASGVVWSQMMVLRALRGEPVAGPRRYRLAAADFIAFIEDLIADLLYPLGLAREPGWRPGYKTAVSPTPAELPVRDAFAIMAAIAATLALPRKVLRAPIAHPAWRREAAMDLSPLWTSPNEDGAVMRCDPRTRTMIAGQVGTAVAMALRHDPAISAYHAARHYGSSVLFRSKSGRFSGAWRTGPPDRPS
jgi:hypothetical protein